MSLIPENTTITLYWNVGITSTQEVVFSSIANQKKYFANHLLASKVNCYYQRRTGITKLEIPIKTAIRANFMSFTNEAFEDRTFYCKILNVDYDNNNTTIIQWQIDWFQTYMFDFSPVRSFIRRQHQNAQDWSISNVNPWSRNVPSLLTNEEELPVYPEMLEMQNMSTITTDFVQPALGNEYAVIQVAKWAEGSDLTEWKELLEGGRVSPAVKVYYADGTVFTSTDGPIPSFSDSTGKVPRPYDVIIVRKFFGTDSTDRTQESIAKIVDFLTQKLVTMEILSTLYIPAKYLQGWFNPEDIATVSIPFPDKSVVTNKKLMRYPFHFLQLVCNGVTAEFRYENFSHNDDTPATFGYIITLDSTPTASVAPLDYLMINTGVQNTKQRSNYEERVDFPEVPQIAYTTDAYLSYVSGSMAEQLSNYSLPVQNTLREWTEMKGSNTLGNYFRHDEEHAPISNRWTGRLANWIGAKASYFTSGDLDYQQKAYQNRLDAAQTRLQSDVYMGNFDIDSEDTEIVFGSQKPLYVADEYHANSGNFLSYYIGRNVSPLSFYLVRRRLNPALLAIYDDFLSLYGYTYNMPGIPYVCNYIAGNTAAYLAPTFINNRTYVKCDNFSCTCPNLEAETYINAIFNSGHIFLKGD